MHFNNEWGYGGLMVLVRSATISHARIELPMDFGFSEGMKCDAKIVYFSGGAVLGGSCLRKRRRSGLADCQLER
jgi:hypothetical protein